MMDLRGVGEDRRRGGIEGKLDCNGLRQRRTQQPHDLFDDNWERRRRAFLALLAAEREDAVHEVACASMSQSKLIEVLFDQLDAIGVQTSEFRIVGRSRQKVVEVVGDAASERAEGFELLGLSQPRLEFGILALSLQASSDVLEGVHDATPPTQIDQITIA